MNSHKHFLSNTEMDRFVILLYKRSTGRTHSTLLLIESDLRDFSRHANLESPPVTVTVHTAIASVRRDFFIANVIKNQLSCIVQFFRENDLRALAVPMLPSNCFLYRIV